MYKSFLFVSILPLTVKRRAAFNFLHYKIYRITVFLYRKKRSGGLACTYVDQVELLRIELPCSTWMYLIHLMVLRSYGGALFCDALCSMSWLDNQVTTLSLHPSFCNHSYMKLFLHL